jgi:hypothetical protein
VCPDLALCRHLPSVFHAHTALESELPYYGPATTRRILRRVVRAFDRRLPSRADDTIIVTTELRARLLAAGLVDPAHITVIGNGLEFDPFEEAERRARARCPGETWSSRATWRPTMVSLLSWKLFAQVRRASRRMPSHRPRRRSRRSKRWPDFGVRKALDIANVGFEAVPGYLAQADMALNPRLGWLGSLSSLLCTNGIMMPAAAGE